MDKQTERVFSTIIPPGSAPTKGGLVINDREIAFVLVRIAESIDACPCAITVDCEVCNVERKVWWDWCMSLAGPVRIAMQATMLAAGIPLPPSPWEEVPTNAVPTPLH